MARPSQLAVLRERVAELEQENVALHAELAELRTAATAAPRGRRALSALAGVLVVLGLLLAPVAAVGTWARLQLVDTERFVATFAPLAHDPEVQALVIEHTTAAIQEQVDVPALVGDVIDGIRELGLPPRADAALALLEAPATAGAQALIGSVVERVVTSEGFARLWEASLRLSHERAIAVLQGDPETVLEITEDGVLAIRLDAVIARVKEQLAERGVAFAQAIPEVERSVPVLRSNSLTLVRALYTVAVTAGTWLPWLVLALLAGGVLLAQQQRRALAWTAAGFALSFALLAAGIGLARLVFVGSVSPGIMPAAAADAVYGQVVELMASTVSALVLLGVLTALLVWLAGPTRPARAIRSLVEQSCASARTAADRQGLTTGRFGAALERHRGGVVTAVVVVGAVVLLFSRPVTGGTVVAVVVGVLLALLLVELLRRPAAQPAPAEAAVA